MDGILLIVLIAAVGLGLLFLYDKRKSIIIYLKEKAASKPIKLPKPKKTNDKDYSPKVKDLDIEPIPENIVFGQWEPPVTTENVSKNSIDDEIFISDDVFAENKEIEHDEDEFDIDKLLNEIQEEQQVKGRKMSSEIYDEDTLPDFDNMSMNDLDNLLDEGFERTSPLDFEEYFGEMDENLSGAELGEFIKKLPKQIKILIISDIFKRKNY